MEKDIKPVPNYEWCSVDTLGNVYNSKTLRRYSPSMRRGYYCVSTTLAGGKKVKISVHRAVALTFIPNPLNLPFVNHKDGNKLNSNVENLEWCTAQQNTLHAMQIGLMRTRYGEETSNWVYSEDLVEDICSKMEQGYRNKDIANLYNVPPKLCSDIRNGKCWLHISSKYSIKIIRRGRLSESTVKWVCLMLSQGFSVKQILEASTNDNLTKSHIKHIKSRIVYKDIVKDFNW